MAEYKPTNQYTAPDPRQALFLGFYTNRNSETFSNAYQSAIKAGYSEEYSKVILNQDTSWISENLKDNKLIDLAEKNLESFLLGEDEKIKADITKFVLSRLNKKKYSERSEVTGADGKDLIPKPILDITATQDENKRTDSKI
jgi:hypothetical protein